MGTTLLTLLGRSTVQEGAYRTTVYEFDDGQQSEPVAFFGWELQKKLKPQRMIVLGTAGSMWDHLFEQDMQLKEQAEEERLALIEAVQNKHVQQEQLDQLAPILSEKLGCSVQLKIIPYCRNQDEQIELLRLIASTVNEGDRVHLDVTHGFRHLPMLIFLSALHLQTIKSVEIKGIWYASYDPDEKKAPVYKLEGLLKLVDWLNGSLVYEWTGDYEPWGQLMGNQIGQILQNAAFYEKTNNLGQARGQVRKVLHHLQSPLTDPIAELFREEIQRRLAWVEDSSFYRRQKQLAYESLKHHRYLESVIFAYEAFISRLVQQAQLDVTSTEHRKQAREQYEAAQKQINPRTKEYRYWDELRRLRNVLVHGHQPKGNRVQRALDRPEYMIGFLKEIYREILS